MESSAVRKLLEDFKNGKLDIDKTLSGIEENLFYNMGFAHIDADREKRSGFPEVIYGGGSPCRQIFCIL